MVRIFSVFGCVLGVFVGLWGCIFSVFVVEGVVVLEEVIFFFKNLFFWRVSRRGGLFYRWYYIIGWFDIGKGGRVRVFVVRVFVRGLCRSYGWVVIWRWISMIEYGYVVYWVGVMWYWCEVLVLVYFVWYLGLRSLVLIVWFINKLLRLGLWYFLRC